MDYLKHYNRLIARGKVRGWTKQSAPCYIEQHHIVPKCVMKDNSTGNLVTLTAEEHFVAHLLLVKIYKDTEHRHKLVYAADAMRLNNHNQQRFTNKQAGWLKRSSAEVKSVRLKGRVFSIEARQKMSESSKRESLSQETRRKMSESSKKENLSVKTRARMSESSKRENLSDETRQRMKEGHRNKPVLTCPHCNLQSKNKPVMLHHHFDNCKHKPQ